MRPVKKLQIGKNGLTDAFVEQVRGFFENERMVKVAILKSALSNHRSVYPEARSSGAKSDAKKIADELVNALGNKYGYKLVGYVITVTKFRKSVR